jgi:hypothetical protein
MTKKRISLFGRSSNKRFLQPKVRSQEVNSVVSEESAPRITNETVTQHREEVLSGARKYIYPLRHSRHKIVLFTISLLVVVLIVFMSYVTAALYKEQSTSEFMYQVTKVLPLPIGRIGGTFISYENYLFELRHYIHYYETQQQVDFSSDQGKAQLAEQRKKSLQDVVNFAYVQKIAHQKNITVSGKEVDAQISLLRAQNKLGNDNKVFENVLKDYWGWTVADFRRSIQQELLTNKVIHALDTATNARANTALAEIRAGKSFGDVAKEFSDDTTTKDNGGQLTFLIAKNDQNVPPQTIDALFKLKPGQVSGVINIGYGLEIVKSLGVSGDKIQAAHILFSYKDISTYLNDYKAKEKAVVYIKV